MENDSAVACESADASTDDRKCIALLEEESLRCNKARRALDIVIAEKSAAKQCYEKDRIEHNRLLQAELQLDNDRMKIIMRLHRATMRDITYF